MITSSTKFFDFLCMLPFDLRSLGVSPFGVPVSEVSRINRLSDFLQVYRPGSLVLWWRRRSDWNCSLADSEEKTARAAGFQGK